jgi:putative transposase
MGLRGRTLYPEADCFFVTTTCYKWYHLLPTDSCKRIVTDSINFLNQKYASSLLGYVIMPNHIHLILFFKNGNRLSDWMRDLKKFTSVKTRSEIERHGDYALLESLRIANRKQVFKVWEDRFDDVISSDSKLLDINVELNSCEPNTRTLEFGM